MNTFKHPTISVLMPVYNAERYVAEAVESILAQTFADFEFIITDDGSTDGSHSILERYAKQDSRIRLISRPNTGYVVALNEMLALARSEFIARMDADDISLSERFARQIAFFEAHEECVALGSGYLVMDPDGQPLSEPDVLETHEEIDAALLAGLRGVLAHPSTMFRGRALLQVGGYRSEFEPCEDRDLFLRLAEVGRLANLKEALLSYRMHSASVCATRTQEQDAKGQAALREAYERRGLPLEALPPLRGRKSLCEAERLRNWVWWALGSGHVKTARKHALRTVRLAPFSLESWRVLTCAMRGY